MEVVCFLLSKSNMSKNYIIFAGTQYYPGGGWKDFYSFADTFENAISIYREALSIGSQSGIDWDGVSINNYPRDWAHIVSIASGEILENEEAIQNYQTKQNKSKQKQMEHENKWTKPHGWERY